MDLDEIRAAVQAAAEKLAEHYIPSRYPWTYSADFLRVHPEIVPEHIVEEVGGITARSSAAAAETLWAAELGVDEGVLASVLADGYLAEHGIPLGIANAERLAAARTDLKEKRDG